MLIIPAVDILNGKVVRLYQGKREFTRIYSEDPLGVVSQWKDEGAKFFHIVDLNASFGEGDNLPLIKEISKLGVRFQVGGGIRSIQRGEKILKAGAEKIILGTKALDEDFLSSAISRFKEHIGVSVDVLFGRIHYEGWKKETDLNPYEFIQLLTEKGITWIIYTDIFRDGTLKGPNIEGIKKLTSFHQVKFIVSGGIANISHIKLIYQEAPFVYGVILGRAIYERKIELKQALNLFS
ncbi:MAG: 1-(5-phosphoribosyl)-5-[(5-phosphoribosylamino)methylideneamino] imidazole-4-carboxamide isomerase [Candidatus Omnitrophica bacterium]|nr:1-(5-phosphoribosyl)-5-[(5-phosphoribosylamino)methylideneamino] imidazole-4-carboxamide isomerase [Candidatus Omnitrophota bacterium]